RPKMRLRVSSGSEESCRIGDEFFVSNLTTKKSNGSTLVLLSELYRIDNGAVIFDRWISLPILGAATTFTSNELSLEVGDDEDSWI
ncbi:hypothetical protein WA026_008861, partial [Henosepilachna vigintioctopunctata]